jgi:hypothetical protein
VSPYDDLWGVAGVEVSRIVTKEGNVVRQMKDGKKVIFGVNGNIIVKQNQLMIVTNNKGFRFKKRLGQDSLEPADAIPT